MALLTFARRLHRAHRHLLLPLNLWSVTHPRPLAPTRPLRPIHYFSETFHRRLHVQIRPLKRAPTFSVFQSSHIQTVSDPFDFSERTHGSSQQCGQEGVHQFVELLKNAERLVSEGGAIAFLDDSVIEPNKDLIYWTIWALKDEWKLALLAFEWGEKWGCNDEKSWGSMIWVLGYHMKFNTAWCLIRDLHRSSMDTRAAMLIMIDRYAAANDPGKAIQTFQIMEKFRMTPDLEAFYVLLNALCKHGNIEEAEEFMFLNKKLFPLEIEAFNIILNGWCNISLDVFEAKRVWREMSKNCLMPNATSYAHMISCFSKVGNLFDSLRMYDEMKKKGWIPCLEVYNSLIYVLTRENCLTEALKITVRIKEVGLRPNSTTYNSMICPLCEAEKLEEARSVLAAMVGENISPTIDTYHGFLKVASLEGTLGVLNNMKKAGLGPNRDTFLLIFSKFVKLEQTENALKIWVEMKQYEIAPDSRHYAVLIEGLAKCGLLTKARELYAEMRASGILDNPKLQKFLKEPAQGSSDQREGHGQPRAVRHRTYRHAYHEESSSIRSRKRGSKRSRKKTSRAT